MMFPLLHLSTALALAAAVPTAAPFAPLRTEQGRFVDAGGRTVVLRGVNVSGIAKVPPFRALTAASDLDPLPGLGFNLIRLLFTWEAFEPERGAYSAAYLNDYVATIEAAWQRGIYTLVDFHQDALARTLLGGCGSGFPPWVLPRWMKQSPPDNGPACALWGPRMVFDTSMRRAWHAVLQDHHGVLDAYATMVERAATRLARVPGVIGYDLINEPMGDEATELAGFYARMGAVVRDVHPSALLFLEPHLMCDIGLRTELPPPSLPQSVYAPHYYDPVTAALNFYPGHPLSWAFQGMRDTAATWRAPLFVGEFGAVGWCRNGDGYIRAVYDQLDAHFISGAQWSYTPAWSAVAKDGWNTEDLSIVDDHGALRPTFTPRPYAQRVAGEPQALSVPWARGSYTGAFHFAWDHVPAQGETVLFVPATGAFAGARERLQLVGADLRCSSYGAHGVRCRAATGGRKAVTAMPAPAGSDGRGAVTLTPAPTGSDGRGAVTVAPAPAGNGGPATAPPPPSAGPS